MAVCNALRTTIASWSRKTHRSEYVMEPSACDRQVTASAASDGGATSSPSCSMISWVASPVWWSASVLFCVDDAFPPVTLADCSKRTDNFSINPSTCFSFSMNCMMNWTRSSAPPLSCPDVSWCFGKLEIICGSKLYTTLVLRLASSWNRMRATRAVGSCTQAVSHNALTKNTARGFSMSFNTKCVSTRSAVSRSSAAAPPSAPGALPSVAYKRLVQGSTTLGCLNNKSPTATSKPCRNVVSSSNAPMPLAPMLPNVSSPSWADNAPAPPFGNKIVKSNCKFSWQNFFDTVMYLQRLIAPNLRSTGSFRNEGSSKHLKSNGLTLSRMFLLP
mmetsp:Transcript_52297/g.158890  ORF Transcript_52297/g.158890 Transcript_52297/m.158890 type:complete len:331 (+) Transcript_52297:121-1113(+)